MVKKTKQRVRLLSSTLNNLPPGICGTILSEFSEQFLIKWDNDEVTLSKEFEDDSVVFGYIIDGYSLLTIDDVLRIGFGKYDDLMKIRDSGEIRDILEQFYDFMRPLGASRKPRCLY